MGWNLRTDQHATQIDVDYCATVVADRSTVNRNLAVVVLMNEHRPDILWPVDERITVLLVVRIDDVITPQLEFIWRSGKVPLNHAVQIAKRCCRIAGCQFQIDCVEIRSVVAGRHVELLTSYQPRVLVTWIPDSCSAIDDSAKSLTAELPTKVEIAPAGIHTGRCRSQLVKVAIVSSRTSNHQATGPGVLAIPRPTAIPAPNP